MMNPELLLPAGDLATLKVAVDNGADAVYAGAASFSARKNAVNFSEDELMQAVAYAHERSTRVYLALNTLIADEELEDAWTTAAYAASCGVDAIIVQDLGLASLIHHLIPDMPLHASTQMTIYDDSAFDALFKTGIRRVILPREISLPEVARMTAAAHQRGLETEMFIHGALCVCFSGQCLFSSLMGGRSGNRGACAQPCRLSYQIKEDDRLLTPAACLSPKDQAAFRHVSEIRQTSVDSLKIEGRMRSASYVGQTAAVYRAMLDARPDTEKNLEAEKERLLLAFNRGGAFTDRAFSGKKDRSYLSGATSGSHGILIGTVAETSPRHGILSIQTGPSVSLPGKGDYLSVRRSDRQHPMDPPAHESEVASAPIGTVLATEPLLQVRGFHPDVLIRLQPGDAVYRMNDARQDQVVLSAKNRRTAIDLTLSGSAEQVTLTACVSEGPFIGVSVQTEVPAETDAVKPLAADRAVEQLARTGGTPFRTGKILVPEPVTLTIAGLNQLRRTTLQMLSERLAKQNRRIVPVKVKLDPFLTDSSDQQAHESPIPVLYAAYFYQWPAPDEPIASGADVYMLPAAGLEKPASRLQLTDLRATEPSAVLVLVLPPAASGLMAEQIRMWRNDGTMRLFDRVSGGHPGLSAIADEQGIGFEMDSTANVYNHLSLQLSITSGSAVTCLSPELTPAQMLLLAASAGGHRLEWFAYGRHRLMYSAFCPVGFNVAGCSRCQGRHYTMTDRKDRTLPLLLHAPYCTSTILHADFIEPPADLPALVDRTPARLRLLFTDERQADRKREISRLRRRYESLKPQTLHSKEK